MSKPILTAFRQLMLSAFLRSSSPKTTALTEPEPKMSDVEPECDVWLFEPKRELAAYRADYGQAMGQLSEQLSGVRALLSRMAPSLPMGEHDYAGARPAVIWSDTLLFDGEPAPLSEWARSSADADMDELFGAMDMIENDFLSEELFGENGQMSALAS